MTEPSAWAQLHAEDTLARPLCVDLDGTLVRTDTLWESVVLLLRRRPWLMLVAPFWLLGGRARFKRYVTGHANLDPAALPYREDLVAALRASRDHGRRLVLATAADEQLAQGVASHLGIFDTVFASDGQHNLKATHKRDRLKSAFAATGFDYIGDSPADLSIFSEAKRGYLVGASASTYERAKRAGQVELLAPKPSLVYALFRQLRVHQWAKNALVVLPVFLAPGLPKAGSLGRALLAALAFSLCASAGYVFNDLLDLEADRAHPSKRERPLASGALPVMFGPPLFCTLIGLSFLGSAALLPLGFSLMLVLYFFATLAYSIYFKKRLLLDVLVLAGLYTHRVLAGGIATGVPISAWLLGFSMFFFLSLAFAKRYVELRALTANKIRNRNYFKADLQMVASMGPASGYIAALVFSLYVESGHTVQTAYREPALLWLVMPVLLYWISRIWVLAGRGEMQDDPVKFALKDPTSLLCGALVAAIAALARFAPEALHTLLH